MAESRNVTVGDRIAMWRSLRGWSQRQLADFSGLSPAFIGFLESGARQLNRRRDLYALADALQCTPEDLTGEMPVLSDPAGVAVQTVVPSLRTALIDGGPDLPPDVRAREVDALMRELRWAQRVWTDGRYEAFGPRVPALIDELHVHAASADEHTSHRALAALVEAYDLAQGLARVLGRPELGMVAAEKAHHAAVQTQERALIGFARWMQTMAMERAGGRRRAPRLADAAIREMEPHAGAGDEQAQMYGMLHLLAGLLAARADRAEESAEHLDEAEALARRTGEGNAFWLHFGPTNVAMWRVGAAVESGEGPRALEIVRGIDAAVIHSPAREADFCMEVGRGLAQQEDGSRDHEALRWFLRAERLAAQKVRSDPLVRGIVEGMARRDRAGNVDLRSFARRIGVGAE